jgi:hypothetical protein
LGWARAHLGSPGEGVFLVRHALTGLIEAGTRVGITDVLTRLAEAQALDGAVADALATIEEALQANPEELVFRPNVVTWRGELRLERGDTTLAEADFRDAIAMARAMNATAWELRAATKLARLLTARGESVAARDLLAPLYASFSEGLDTPDLVDARSVLDRVAT